MINFERLSSLGVFLPVTPLCFCRSHDVTCERSNEDNDNDDDERQLLT